MSRLDSLYTQVSAVGALSPSPKIQANLHDTALLFSQLKQGPVLSGEIVGKTDQSTYLIRIGQQLIELPLREQFRAGDTLQLRLTNHTPEIRISVFSPQAGNSDPVFFQLEHINGKIVFREFTPPQLNVAGNASSIADFSKTGQLLDQLVNELLPDKVSGIQLAALQFDPLNPASVQQSLQDSMKNSGLFVYAHLKKILDGKLGIQDLNTEFQQLRQQQGDGEAVSSLLQGQLSVLESNLASLHFSAPGGVDIRWNTQRNAPDQHSETVSDPTDFWLTELDLSFPLLGKIHVRISLTGNQVILGCKLAAGSSDLLQKHASELLMSLKSAGTEPQMVISSKDVT